MNQPRPGSSIFLIIEASLPGWASFRLDEIWHMAQVPGAVCTDSDTFPQVFRPLSFIKPILALKAATNQNSSHSPPIGRIPQFGNHWCLFFESFKIICQTSDYASIIRL
ncbi:hypothetical protein T4D_115 [Trichinella pseudospiralis]|uniref:Uncharacterized protein n=1 Tax=Trichinella pseudospiralis TaxID=6337 RepID=A0A0V1G1U4_TRIPS|nr:hypothetical protein T4D_115 [Trichinella pseudospiralis]